MVLSSLAGTIETLFLGWELVGLSSALLVAFFHNRKNPVRNGQRVWAVYRIADAAFLIAALVLHHLTGGGDFSELMGAGTWPESQAMITSGQALVVGLLLLVAAAGKSALVPFSGRHPPALYSMVLFRYILVRTCCCESARFWNVQPYSASQ
jgi:NAD(P)H-quinone oxidoreductase subunit 5